MFCRVERCWTALCVLLIGLFLHSSPAHAVAFGRYGTGAGEFIEPNGIAIDQRSGDVYVLDTDNERVDKFTKDGRFLLAWGRGIAGGKAHELQYCTPNMRCFSGLAGAGPGEMGFAEGLAVDNDPQSSAFRDVYAVDLTNHRVEKFSPAGRFLAMFGGGVNASAHTRKEVSSEDRCPVKPHDRCGPGRLGGAHGEFDFGVEGNFVSVGGNGTVYVGDRNRVQEFAPTGAYLTQIMLTPAPQGSGSELGGTIALAVNRVGEIYVSRNGVSGVRRYSPQGTVEQTVDEEGGLEWFEGPTPMLTLDTAGHLFVDYHAGGRHWMIEYDASGNELARFDYGREDALHGMAYNARTQELYVVNTNSNISPYLHQIRRIKPPPLVDPVLTSFRLNRDLPEGRLCVAGVGELPRSPTIGRIECVTD